MTDKKPPAPSKRTTAKKPPSYTAIVAAIDAGALTEEELWDIQVAAAEQQLTKGSGARWVIKNPYVGEFNEDSTTAREYKMVAERLPGITLDRMGYGDMLSNPALVYEFMRAHLIAQKGKDPEEADEIVGRLEMRSLIAAVRMEVVKPDPKSSSGSESGGVN